MINHQEIRNEIVRYALEVARWADRRGLCFVAEERKRVADKLSKGASVSVEAERGAVRRLKERQ